MDMGMTSVVIAGVEGMGGGGRGHRGGYWWWEKIKKKLCYEENGDLYLALVNLSMFMIF